jgi:hypothetical protein
MTGLFLPRGVYILPFTTPRGTRLMVAVTASGALAAEPAPFTLETNYATHEELWQVLDQVDPQPPRMPERRARGVADRRRQNFGPPPLA